MRDILDDLEAALLLPPMEPMKSAQESMRPRLPKRFYKEVNVVEADGVFTIALDGRTVKTPGKLSLSFKTEAAAKLVADEFAAQGERIDPRLMPCYRLANTAQDGVAQDMQAVIEDILRFSGTDLLCYRAGFPEILVERQRAVWDGPLEWAENLIGNQFVVVEGVMHQAQPRETIAGIGAQIKPIDDPMVLASFHSMMTLTGSAILALAVFKGHLTADDAWKAAHVDEDHTDEQWGVDDEARDRRSYRWIEMQAAHNMIKAHA